MSSSKEITLFSWTQREWALVKPWYVMETGEVNILPTYENANRIYHHIDKKQRNLNNKITVRYFGYADPEWATELFENVRRNQTWL